MKNWDKLLNNARLRTSKRGADSRNDFESDYGRIIFSPAIRRMHDKTQVFPLTTDDNIHSRLTHSMEVMAIGHSLGVRLCKEEKFLEAIEYDKEKLDLERVIPILLQNASLVHDIGNPPFGHFGETVIQNYFKEHFSKNEYELTEEQKKDFTHFDGNAQGFRVLTKLQYLDDLFGLNLTYATLSTYLKYPNTGNLNKSILSQKKIGVFQSEKEYLEKIASESGLIREDGVIVRHPLAYLVEAADSICYLVMDIEDGFNKNWYTYEEVKKEIYEIIEPEFWKKNEDRLSTVDKVVKLRIHLIAKLVNLAINNFVINLNNIYVGIYNKELIFDDSLELAKKLQNFCGKKIFVKREVQSLELTGHSVLVGLLNFFIQLIFNEDKNYRKRAKGLISKSILELTYKEYDVEIDDDFSNLTDYYKLRMIVDYISGMTDQYALNLYQKLSGQKIS